MDDRGLARSWWPALLASLLAPSSCQADGTATTAAASATATPSSSVAVGSEVVAARGELSFVQGTVAAIVGDQITVRSVEGADGGAGATLTVPQGRAWLLGAASVFDKGGAAICRLEPRPLSGPSWQPCLVEAVAPKVRASDARGVQHTLEPARVVLPDPTTAARLARYLEREARHRAFDEAFAAAGAPFRAPGWTPAAGEKVVARFVDASWYGAAVLETKVAKGKVRIAWDGGTWDDQDVPLADVAPRPRGEGALRVGQFALAPPGEVSGRWQAERVVALSGAAVTVESRDGARAERRRSELLPVGE